MHPFFSVTLFTGQQLVLEALQRWLQRPCPDAAAVQRRHRGLKQLIGLLLRTAATGVLATVLDAAIEFRRRQLLAAAAADPAASGAAAAGRFPGLSMLTRSGVAAWKSRLVLAIDELERRAGEYGIESRYRFGSGKDAEDEAAAASSVTCKAPALPCRAACSCLDLAAGCSEEEEERSLRLGATVEQLQQLVKQNDAESQRRLDSEMGSLVDLILGTTLPPGTPTPGAAAAAHARSYSVPAALDRLGGAAPCAAAHKERSAQCGSQPGSPSSGGGGSGGDAELCAICMDRCVSVQVSGCCHDLCFGCARRLCAAQDHQVPQCPFCRQAIEGFSPLTVPRCTPSASRGAAAAAVAAAVRA